MPGVDKKEYSHLQQALAKYFTAEVLMYIIIFTQYHLSSWLQLWRLYSEYLQYFSKYWIQIIWHKRFQENIINLNTSKLAYTKERS